MSIRWVQGDLILFHRGDPFLFRRLVDQHSPRLLSTVRSYANDLDEAHDLVQETWIRVYRKRRSFSGHGTFLGWLLSVCRNVCLDARAKSASRSRFTVEHSSDGQHGYPAADAEADRNELRHSIAQALAELPPRERDVVVLRLIEGHSVRETAQRMECAEGTVKAALHHAITKLRGSMEVWAR